MKLTIRLEVSDAIRLALKRYNESKHTPTKAEVADFFKKVCAAAVFAIVEHDDAKKIKPVRASRKPTTANP